jgi:hypothetical protein
MNWINLAQDGAQWWGSCEHGDESSGSVKYCDTERLLASQEGFRFVEVVS